ncbi:MAG: cytochrome c3 family protein [Candidatus Aminicenantia bacterium]
MRLRSLCFSALLAIFSLTPIISQEVSDCLVCHEDESVKTPERPGLFLKESAYSISVHGKAGLTCVDCHTDLKGFMDFPHPEKLKKVDCSACHSDINEEMKESVHQGKVQCQDCHGTHYIIEKDNPQSSIYSLNIPRLCEGCHLKKVKVGKSFEFIKLYDDSVHGKALTNSGLIYSATCVSCHGAHDIMIVSNENSRVSRKNIPYTCGKCHSGILQDFIEGVHGKDFLKGIKDVPVCTDCHGEHDIYPKDQTRSNVYHTKVPQVCGKCHADKVLARKYGFSTFRVSTYQKSFHGIATGYGDLRNANCASCHGYHNIRRSTDPKSTIYPENIPKTCGKCHKGAGKDFAKGKIHVWDEKKENIWVYIVRKFYTIMISVIIGGFVIFISVEMYAIVKRGIIRKKK